MSRTTVAGGSCQRALMRPARGFAAAPGTGHCSVTSVTLWLIRPAPRIDRGRVLCIDSAAEARDEATGRTATDLEWHAGGGWSHDAPGRPDDEASGPGAAREPQGAASAEDHRHPDDPHRAEPHPAGRREGRDERAGPGRLRLRHLHPARPGGADGRRAVPQAVSHRAQRRRDRGHLAVLLRQLVLAQRRRAVQRDERRGHRAVGHQGQARQHAALPVARRQGAARRRLLLPRQRPRLPGGGGQRAERHGGRIPARPRAGRRARAVDLRHAQHDRGRRDVGRGDRPDQPRRHLGIGPVRPHAAEAVRAPAQRSWARRWSCCTTSTSACS